MDIKLNLSYYASNMLNAFRDLLYVQNYAGIIGLGLMGTLKYGTLTSIGVG